MRIEIVDPPSALVLFGVPADVGGGESWGMSTWQFVVRNDPEGTSRLLTRGRYDHSPDWRSRLTFPYRGHLVRDEPQDDARDQAAGRAHAIRWRAATRWL
jgi:hypothetical protein